MPFFSPLFYSCVYCSVSLVVAVVCGHMQHLTSLLHHDTGSEFGSSWGGILFGVLPSLPCIAYDRSGQNPGRDFSRLSFPSKNVAVATATAANIMPLCTAHVSRLVC